MTEQKIIVNPEIIPIDEEIDEFDYENDSDEELEEDIRSIIYNHLNKK